MVYDSADKFPANSALSYVALTLTDYSTFMDDETRVAAAVATIGDLYEKYSISNNRISAIYLRKDPGDNKIKMYNQAGNQVNSFDFQYVSLSTYFSDGKKINAITKLVAPATQGPVNPPVNPNPSPAPVTNAPVTSKEAPRISAFERTIDRYTKEIQDAKAGSTVVIKGDASFNALPNSVMQNLVKKKDISLKFSYSYKGQEYTITIPAGEAQDNAIPWYGPMYLWKHYGK